MKKLISFVVPSYKKEKEIKDCVLKDLEILHEVCRKYNFDYELLVVIDGKLDNTQEVLESIKNPHVRVYQYEKNMGKGFAVKYGMSKAKGDYIGFIDAGWDINPDVLRVIIETANSNPDVHVFVGSKKHKDSKLVYPLKRKIFTTGYAIVSRIFVGINYKDSQVGIKLFTRELVDKVLPRMVVKKFAFDIELLAISHMLGYKEHIDIPVEVNFTADASASSVTTIKPILRMISDTAKVGYRLKLLKFYEERNKHLWEPDADIVLELNYSELQ